MCYSSSPLSSSAHSPLFEEPEKLLEIVQEDVLVGVTYQTESEGEFGKGF